MNPTTKWILAIVGLLGGNMIAMGVLIAASHDGGSQVIPAYYDKAVHYDEAIDQDARNSRLGWTADVQADGGALVITVRDRTGAAVDATIHVEGYARAHADHPFAFTGPRAPFDVHGVVDLTISADRGGDHFVQKQAIEVP